MRPGSAGVLAETIFSGEHRLPACKFRQPAETVFNRSECCRQSAGNCGLAARAPQNENQKSPRLRDACATRNTDLHRVHCAHSSRALDSPRKNARASPAKWREPVIKTRSLLRCAAEIASATDGVME